MKKFTSEINFQKESTGFVQKAEQQCGGFKRVRFLGVRFLVQGFLDLSDAFCDMKGRLNQKVILTCPH